LPLEGEGAGDRSDGKSNEGRSSGGKGGAKDGGGRLYGKQRPPSGSTEKKNGDGGLTNLTGPSWYSLEGVQDNRQTGKMIKEDMLKTAQEPHPKFYIYEVRNCQVRTLTIFAGSSWWGGSEKRGRGGSHFSWRFGQEHHVFCYTGATDS